MMMPPTYRDLWKGAFGEIKKADVQNGKSWMYEADPFLAKKERDEAQAMREKKREDREKQTAKEQGISGGGAQTFTGGPAGRGSIVKGWTRVPKVEMGKKTRKDVEALIRQYGAWNPHGVHISVTEKADIIEDLSTLGFRRSHLEEAAEICKDKKEILEWLLVHVPEDDLPNWALPEGYSAGISMASSDLKREAAIKSLAAAGYSTELCEEVLDENAGDEGKAAESLQQRLMGGVAPSLEGSSAELSPAMLHPLAIDPHDEWEEEQTVLASIYDARYGRVAPDVCQILLHVPLKSGGPLHVQIRRPSGPYPNVVPILSIHAKLPAYIRLSITRRALEYAKRNLLGQQMIFNLVDWLEHESEGIIESPGRLSDISTVTSSVTAAAGSSFRSRTSYKRKGHPRAVEWQPGTETSVRLLAEWQAKQATPAQRRMITARQSLPAWSMQEAIVSAVATYQVVIISGETGSGKSTQAVQFILDDMIKRQLGEAANIICTQPRRISALGLADRVAHERCSTVGDEIGYAIRGESKQMQGYTKITFVTTGVLLRRMQTSGGRPEDTVAALADVTHVVVDEVHERNLDTDFLLVLIRDVLKRRKDLRIILMSATLDAEVFEAFFGGRNSVRRIEIQGRTHPVEDHYLDDVIRMTGFQVRSDVEENGEEEPSIAGAIQRVGMKINYYLISQVVQCIHNELGTKDGGILIFLPGTLEINRTLDALRATPNLYALPLHASLTPAEQRQVFPPAAKGKRKVIASTNVAETSITIEDIVAVIDTGRVKETAFDPQSNMVKLEEVWASKAACKQRRGRAGRARPGVCYKLYTRNAEWKMAERPEPEIRRVPLDQLCLSVKAMGVTDVSAFLASALTPPESIAVEGAMSLLARMGALDGGELTALGRHLSIIPADLRCGKLLVYGAMFRCLDACLTISAILTARSPFLSPQTKRDEAKAARAAFGDGHGDLISDFRAYNEWDSLRNQISSREVRMWCEHNFLSSQTLSDISSNRIQYIASLKEIGFLHLAYHSSAASAARYHVNNDNMALLRALIAGSFNPQVASIEFPDKKYVASISGAVELDPEARTIKYFNQENGRVFVHPASTLFDAQSFSGNAMYMSFFSKMSTSKVFIRELTRK